MKAPPGASPLHPEPFEHRKSAHHPMLCLGISACSAPQPGHGSPARAPTFQLAAVVGGVSVLLILPVVPRGRFVPRHL